MSGLAENADTSEMTNREGRVLIATSVAEDGETLRLILEESGLQTALCQSVPELCAGIESGAALAILAEEMLTRSSEELLADTLRQQAEWSDFPLIVIAARGDARHRGWTLLSDAGVRVHAILLQRPAWRATLLSAVRAASQSRSRQYQVRDELLHRSQVESAHREGEARYRQVVQAMPVAVYTTDDQGRITLFNDAAASLWGREPVLGTDLWCGSWKIFRPDGSPLPNDECPMAITLQTQRAVTGEEVLIERPDGTRRSVLPYPDLLVNGSGAMVGAVNILVDITERKQSQIALFRSEVKFKALFNSMHEGFAIGEILCDDTGQPEDVRCLEVNPAFEKHTGIRSIDVLGRNMRELFPEPDSFWIAQFAKAAIDGEAVHFQACFGPLGKWFEVSIYQTEPGRCATLFFDITERKRVEDALKEADRRKDEFLATLAHELRNPLAPLSNAVDLLRMNQSDSPLQNEIRGIMERQVRHLSRLVDDLLDVSRVTRGKIELRKERVELAAILKNAIETSKPLLNVRHQRLTVSTVEEPIILNADSLRIAQVVANLLNNAGKYTEEGGEITLTVSRNESSAVISVRDTGIGIPPEMLETVFELFKQVDQSLIRTQGGLGIGLTLARSFVEMHGGRLEARSAGIGQGSEFIVSLPLADSTSVSPPARTNEHSVTLRKRRIMVIDDTRAAAVLMGRLLEALGQEVEICSDARTAVNAALSSRPEIIFSDIAMPHVDGYKLASQLRADERLKDTMLVALTGFGQGSDRQRALDAGFDLHLVKPVSLSMLTELLSH